MSILNTLKSITDGNLTYDDLQLNELILYKINLLPDSYELTSRDFITDIDCTVEKENVIINSKETFNKIYSTGREIFTLLTAEYKNTTSFNNYLSKGILDSRVSKQLKTVFNKYVEENGFPYLISDCIKHPSYYEFMNECMTVYLIDEVRKLNLKNKNPDLPGFGEIYYDEKFINFYNLIKPELISLTTNNQQIRIADNVDKLKTIEMLELGPYPTDKGIEAIENYTEDFFLALQRSLILYVSTLINSEYKNQYIITKHLPIFNATSKQYRIYLTAYSLIAVAYNQLLLNLTSTEWSYERRICALPGCNNEFEAVGKIKYCEKHLNKDKNSIGYKERKKYENKVDYQKNYPTRRLKKHKSDSDKKQAT